MSFDDFQNATLRQIENYTKGWQQRQKIAWHRTHWQTIWLLSPNIKKAQMAKVERAMRAEWDPDNAKAPEYSGDVEGMLSKFDEIVKAETQKQS